MQKMSKTKSDTWLGEKDIWTVNMQDKTCVPPLHSERLITK